MSVSKTGGAWRIVMRSTDGTDYPITGAYCEFVKNERLVMTMDCPNTRMHVDLVKPNRRKEARNPVGEMLQTVTFEPRAAGQSSRSGRASTQPRFAAQW